MIGAALPQYANPHDQWTSLQLNARSFRWGASLLGDAERRRVAALYLFCREVDDLADEERGEPFREELHQLSAALEAELTGGNPEDWPDEFLWFRDFCRVAAIDFRVVRELVVGLQSDLGEVRLRTDRDLLRYCYRVAGTVGLMMCSVLEIRGRVPQLHAIDLGIAMQLTNICRDVKEDAASGRVYLPQARLRAHGTSAESLLDGTADPKAVSAVVEDLLLLAESYYQSGIAGIPFLPRRTRPAIIVASHLYRAIGRRLRTAQGCNPLEGRAIVPWTEKVPIALRSLLDLTPRISGRLPARDGFELHEHLEGLPFAAGDQSREPPRVND